MDDAVQNIIADVGCGSFHALHVNLTLSHIEIVVQELPGVFCLPEKIFGDISPELWTQRDKHWLRTCVLRTKAKSLANLLSVNGTSKNRGYCIKKKKNFN